MPKFYFAFLITLLISSVGYCTNGTNCKTFFSTVDIRKFGVESHIESELSQVISLSTDRPLSMASPHQLQRAQELRDAWVDAYDKAFLFENRENPSNYDTLSKLMRQVGTKAFKNFITNLSVVPKNGVIHIIGSGDNYLEWALILMYRPDVHIVLSEINSNFYDLNMVITNPNPRLYPESKEVKKRVQQIWELIDKGKSALQLPTVMSFEDFQTSIKERLSLAFKYTAVDYSQKYAVPPFGMSKDTPVPKADMVISRLPYKKETRDDIDVDIADPLDLKNLAQIMKPNGFLYVSSEHLGYRTHLLSNQEGPAVGFEQKYSPILFLIKRQNASFHGALTGPGAVYGIYEIPEYIIVPK